MASRMETYKKRAGTNADHGLKFERDIMCLIYVRCLKLYKINKLKSFKIANNVDHVGAFDDIVCRIEYEENGSLKTRLIFIQTKHREDPIKNAFSDETLMPPRKRRKIEKPPPIFEYIKSFFQILPILDESKNSIKTSDNNISADEMKKIEESLRQAFDCKLEDAQFVYYSNETTKELQYFCQKPDSGMVKNIIGTSFSNEIYKSKLNHMELIDMYPEAFKNISPNEVESLKQFLDSFLVYVSQESERGIESIIIKEIESIDSIKIIDLNILYKILCDEMKYISQANEVPFITEKNDYVQKIFSLLLLHSQTSTVKEKFSRWSMLYSDETIEELNNDVMKGKVISIQYERLVKPNFAVQCLQLAEYLKERNNDFCFLFVNKDSFEMWREVRKLYNYSVHSKVLVCIDNVLIDDVRKVCSTEVGTQELVVIISENNTVNKSFLWTQFSSAGFEQFMNYIVCFQNVSVNLREIFGNIDFQKILDNTDCKKVLDALISRVLNNEYINIGCSLPVEEDIYIERRYKTNATFLKFEALNEVQDIFLLYPKRNVPSSLNVDNFKNVSVFENEEEARYHFLSCSENNQSTYLCFINESLMIISSKGTLRNIEKYEIKNYVMNEDEFIQIFMNNKCSVISDYVGMGKSTALKRLSHYIKTRCKDKWVEYINLNLLDKKLKNINRATNPICAVMQLLNTDDMGRMIFHHKCSTNGKVALLFDGFDEISYESRDNFKYLVQALTETKINTIVVSTRPNVETELRNYLISFHFNIIGFCYEKMYLYLLKFWSKSIDKEYTEKLPEIVQDIVNQSERMEKTLRDIVAVPLQTKMLAETYNKKIITVLSSKKGLQSFTMPKLSLYSLYNNFINMHIDRCLQEKFEITDSNLNNYELMKISLFKINSGIWETLACQELFMSTKICEATKSDIDKIAKQRIGIFVNTDPEKITFVHRSFAEFLAAKQVTRLLCETKNTDHLNFIYQRICIDKTFVILRKFMNAIYENESFWETAEINCVPELEPNNNVLNIALMEGNAFLFKVIHRHLSKIEDFLKIIFNLKYNTSRQTLLHTSALYCEYVFNDILNSEFFYTATDLDAFGQTALHVACCTGNEKVVISFLSKLQNENLSLIINQSDIRSLTPMMMAAQSGHTNIMKILQDRGASIHSKNKNGSNAFFMANRGGCIETIKYLIEQGININETDNVGMTSLMDACEKIKYFENNKDIVRYLVEKAGADVNIQDCTGRTALMHLAVNDKNIKAMKLLIQHGANTKAVDSKGRNVLMLAAVHGQKETVKYFFDLGVDIHAVDYEGKTANLLAEIHGQKEMVKYFSEIGVNIVDEVDVNEVICLTLLTS